ncbi:hypothetical protein SSX86_009499 [Deinandra increscens subsp. villosa]|uniref:TIR domain-containing protein n=1 Tax=Deinandra increscens subsp. villosa TaxID=3103831 RepID=A0AAP0D963_9ASTR
MTTTSTSSGFSYDVFLSFRGEDTRHTFTDHLYAALKQAAIRTFRDDDAMDRGKLLDPELKKAIHESAISIIVFSRNYASSKWCLDEVLTIIEEQERLSSKHEVVPVFYHVEPSDVRNQTGSFEKAFEKPEAEFISKIVNVIRKKLNYNLLYVDDNLIGIKNHVDRIESWLQDPSPEAVILLIHGMGGIGKSTIAKCIYNSNYKEYDVSCFLADIHETSNHHNGGFLRLQAQLLSKILRSEKEEVIWNLDEGIMKVANALCNKKVLLVLDDIKTRKQLLYLLGRQQFYTGSKVIITTRDISLLTNFNIPPMVHPIEELGLSDSKELFCMYAFRRDHPIEPYILQTKLIIQHCGGLPLALKVLGSYLNRKNINVWKDAMRKLDEIPNPDIQKVLQLSFDTLEETKDKDLFLYIACFFVGEKEEFIVKLLAECDLYPEDGIQNLKDRSLLYIEFGSVMMHQLIKEMGQEVVRQESPKDPGKRSRLWNYQDSYKVLRENEGTRKVEGLVLDMRRIKGIYPTSIVNRENGIKRCFEDFSGHTFPTNKENFKVVALEKMKNLMLLQLDYATFSGSYKKLPKTLRLLRWHGFPLKSIPSDVSLQKLVVLDLCYSKLEEVWDGFKEIGSLKILNLSYSLKLMKTPDFRGLPSLESLLLEGCESLTQVLYEFGIFSIYVLGKTLPCFRYNYKKKGSTISFTVPSHPNGSGTSGLNVCFMYAKNIEYRSIPIIEVNNKTKVLVWIYNPTARLYQGGDLEYNVWLSFWRTGNLLDYGDEIVVSITLYKYGGTKVEVEIVEECCVNLVYDEDNEEEIGEEKKDMGTLCMLNQISWSERMHVEISDYVHSGKTYFFEHNGFILEDIEDESTVDWRGPGPETSWFRGLEYNGF